LWVFLSQIMFSNYQRTKPKMKYVDRFSWKKCFVHFCAKQCTLVKRKKTKETNCLYSALNGDKNHHFKAETKTILTAYEQKFSTLKNIVRLTKRSAWKARRFTQQKDFLKIATSNKRNLKWKQNMYMKFFKIERKNVHRLHIVFKRKFKFTFSYSLSCLWHKTYLRSTTDKNII